MQLSASFVVSFLLLTSSVSGRGNGMVKMCLDYPNESGHARSDPIVDQPQCPSIRQVHTFYGPQHLHPNTSYEDIRETPARFSTTPFVANQSLQWHPSIYRLIEDDTGDDQTYQYTSVSNLQSTLNYRWDRTSNTTASETVAFPPGFRMIAHSSYEPTRASMPGESSGQNIQTECCDMRDDAKDDCETWNKLHFPTFPCGWLDISFSMPTCWNEASLGDDNDHKSHMAYTRNGEINGPCPSGFTKRVPHVELVVRIANYQGGTYQLSNGASTSWHVDFFNGWKEGKLQELIDTCQPDQNIDIGEDLPCSCAEEKLTKNTEMAGAVCDSDIRRLVMDEAIPDIVTGRLSFGASSNCQEDGSAKTNLLIAKSWTHLPDDIIQCTPPVGGNYSGDRENDGKKGDFHQHSTPHSGVTRNVLSLAVVVAILVLQYLLEHGYFEID
ncbi:unnamed protein product [Cylindrotheca closterium]|uniref:DUF1996 domain-containing protein n=1 Tax=Cylindrotheca closterium TaxID=2856 RepID=A0AAD2FXZ7_9STRA|nr:unnamed protein product [Cylindrotheca closterium]